MALFSHSVVPLLTSVVVLSCVMTTERRWYDPPAPRDWHPTAAQLQRLESSSSLRKVLLDRSSKGFDRASIHSSSSRRSDVYDSEKSVLDSSVRGSLSSRTPSSKGVPLGRSLSKGVPNHPHQAALLADSVADFGASLVSKKSRDQEDMEMILRRTPSSRARSSSMTKYEPLPAINASPQTAGTMDTNNNKEPEFEPPPLIRSRTFDVIDTKMKNLPVVDDDDDDDGVVVWGVRKEVESPTHTVTVNIEGKPLSEFLSHARDGLLKSRPGTRYGRSDRPGSSTTYRELPAASYELTESSELQSELRRSENSIGEAESETRGGEDPDEDIIVYFKLPDDSLLLASSPRGTTLRELLQVVGNTQMGGRRLVVTCRDLNPSDLDRSLADLGITDNTTLYLLDQ